MKEIWKPIKGYEKYYQVSNKGRIKSLLRKMKGRFGGYFYTKVRILIPQNRVTPAGKVYKKIDLSINGVKKQKAVHILVGVAFISNPKNKKCINHLNRNPSDNRSVNLEWATHQENTLHWMSVDGGISGSKNSRSTPIKMISMNGVVKIYGSMNEAARLNNFSQGNIWGVCNGLRKSHKGYKFLYI